MGSDFFPVVYLAVIFGVLILGILEDSRDVVTRIIELKHERKGYEQFRSYMYCEEGPYRVENQSLSNTPSDCTMELQSSCVGEKGVLDGRD